MNRALFWTYHLFHYIIESPSFATLKFKERKRGKKEERRGTCVPVLLPLFSLSTSLPCYSITQGPLQKPNRKIT
jgi:hypothetical protein